MKIRPPCPSRPWIWLPALLLWLAALVPASATTVLEVGVGEMTRRAELVFEGRVVHRESQAAATGRLIHTYVTFEVLDVIKGRAPGQTLVLRFLGGEVKGRSLRVDRLRLPRWGEHGVYFVESVTRPLANPLYGWSQGHLLVTRDATGRTRVRTTDGRTVAGVSDGDGPFPARPTRGAARGLRFTGGGDALTLEAFKDALRGLATGTAP